MRRIPDTSLPKFGTVRNFVEELFAQYSYAELTRHTIQNCAHAIGRELSPSTLGRVLREMVRDGKLVSRKITLGVADGYPRNAYRRVGPQPTMKAGDPREA